VPRVIKMVDKISAGMAATNCQFCGASFKRGIELTLHYQDKHPDEIGKEQES